MATSLILVALALASTLCCISAEEKEFVYKEPPSWSTANGSIYVYGKHIYNIRGINWWGAQGARVIPFGMDTHTLDWHLDILKKYGFNAIRYPLAIPTVMNATVSPWKNLCTTEKVLCKEHPMKFLETLIDRAAERGILVMPGLNRLGFYPPDKNKEFWYTDNYPEKAVLDTLDHLVTLFKKKWNFFAIDIVNEAHGRTTWGSGDLKTDLRQAAIRFVEHLGTKHPDWKGLFFVQAMCCFRKWFQGIDLTKFPVKTGMAELDNRVVYSGHHYRPGRQRADQRMETDEELKKNLDGMFGHVEKQTGHAQVFGEWGDSWENPKGQHWMKLFGRWMKKNCQTNFFYWCLQFGEGQKAILDTDDLTTPKIEKIRFLRHVQKIATMIEKTDDGYSVSNVGDTCA